MNVKIKAYGGIDQKAAAIYEIREKRQLLDKCQRKLQLAALDRDDVRILGAAREQLTADINKLCWMIGL